MRRTLHHLYVSCRSDTSQADPLCPVVDACSSQSTGNSKRRGKGWKMKTEEDTPTKPKSDVELRILDMQEAVGEMTSEV